MKDRRAVVRYLGFHALSDGGRRCDFSFDCSDASLRLVSIEAAWNLFSGPDHIAIQECAGICYETLRCVVEGSASVPPSIKLTSADVAQHRKRSKTFGRRATA